MVSEVGNADKITAVDTAAKLRELEIKFIINKTLGRKNKKKFVWER